MNRYGPRGGDSWPRAAPPVLNVPGDWRTSSAGSWGKGLVIADHTGIDVTEVELLTRSVSSCVSWTRPNRSDPRGGAPICRAGPLCRIRRCWPRSRAGTINSVRGSRPGSEAAEGDLSTQTGEGTWWLDGRPRAAGLIDDPRSGPRQGCCHRRVHPGFARGDRPRDGGGANRGRGDRHFSRV